MLPPQPSASADNTNLSLDNSRYHAQPHPIIVKYHFTYLVSLSIRLFGAGGGGGDRGRRKGREKPDTSALIQAFHPRAT